MLNELISIQEASYLASKYTKRNFNINNISYLIKYGKIKNYNNYILIQDLKNYLNETYINKEKIWKDKLGKDLNWHLSFNQLQEKETTKHVHRLHPYKGKFIPQLVEYFLDGYTDNFKKEACFKENDIILDPFSGSGTTLVQANELNMHSIGVDISRFNCLMSDVKLSNVNLKNLREIGNQIIKNLYNFTKSNKNIISFNKELETELKKFNNQYFPVPKYRYEVNRKLINEKSYGEKKEKEFVIKYNELVRKYNIQLNQNSQNNNFIDTWYMNNIRQEMNLVFSSIKKIKNENIKNIITIILSRTIRSCRATTHSDLATLIKPQISTYYCVKHKKICRPIMTIQKMFVRYFNDTIKRLDEFKKVRTDKNYQLFIGDSRNINIEIELKKQNKDFYRIFKQQKIAGVFTSPPYVGQIDYHEQHAYAYDLFNFKRSDDLEIGPLFKGQGKEARDSYVEGIANVLKNCKRFLKEDYNIFLVANDKYNLYPNIVKKAEMKIVNRFKRPVLNRSEKNKNFYGESIFHIKEDLE